MQSVQPVPCRLLRLPEVSSGIGLQKTCIYGLIAAGRFPRPVQLTATAVAWRSDEVAAWVAARCAERDAQAARRPDGQTAAGGAT